MTSENRQTETAAAFTMPPMDLDHDACYRALRSRDARFDGKLFAGVTTTGIYCRPVCPARTPKRGNVVFFASAAAAQEAGFRPCLRCRPETAPELAAWQGTSNTVSRALTLIEAGALDDARVDSLALKLGVGERQLRRLFRQHLGASPIAVAQTRRVLLAKQLLHETELPVTDVALAAGFGSIRRFNEAFHDVFGCPPRALRRRAVTVPHDGAVTILLRYRAPYDWPAMVTFLAARAIPGVEAVSSLSYARTIEVAGEHGTVQVQPADGDALRVTVRIRRMSALPAILARVRGVFDLAADPLTIGGHLSEDEVLAPMIAERPGLRVPGAWDGFEVAIRAILGQQITVAAAVRLAARLATRHGERLRVAAPGTLTHVFPSAEHLAQADLSGLGVPRARAAALTALARAAAADPQIFSRRASLDEAVQTLRALPGVGDWTAQYIAMRELRETDAFPAADTGLLRALARVQGCPVTPRVLLARAERWRPWRAYAAQHLWASLAGGRREDAA